MYKRQTAFLTGNKTFAIPTGGANLIINSKKSEEETNADDLVKKMELFGSDAKSLYMLDQELAGRVSVSYTHLDRDYPKKFWS